MHAITIPLFEEMQLASGRSSAQLEADLKLYLSTTLYEMGIGHARSGGGDRGPIEDRLR